MSEQKNIHLEKNERTELEQLIKSGTHSARVIARARVLLLLDRSLGHKRKISEVVDAAMVSQGTVSNVKKRYFAVNILAALCAYVLQPKKPSIKLHIAKEITKS